MPTNDDLNSGKKQDHGMEESGKNAETRILEMLKDGSFDELTSESEDEERKLIHLIKVFRIAQSQHSGPLPRPQDIELYNLHIPNGGDRLMCLVENQQAHRIELEKVAVGGQMRQSGIGQIFALVIGLFGIACGTYAIIQGHDWAGATIAGSTLLGLVSAFITGQRKQRQDLETKAETLKK